jgi:hypothetical protein
MKSANLVEGMKTALGGIVGLGLAYLAGWALNESALVHRVLGAAYFVWFVGSFIVGTVLVIRWLFWFLFSGGHE